MSYIVKENGSDICHNRMIRDFNHNDEINTHHHNPLISQALYEFWKNPAQKSEEAVK